MQQVLQHNDTAAAGKVPVAPTQSAFLENYQWRADQDRLTAAGVAANSAA